MFGKLFRSNKTNDTVLNFIKDYPNRHKYFIRTKPWDWLNAKEIYLPTKVDGKPTMIMLDFWSQEVFLDASGQITVEGLVELTCRQYKESNMDIPEGLDKMLIETLESLVFELKVVEFLEVQKELSLELEKPISKQ